MVHPLEELYTQHKKSIYNYLLRSTMNRHIAEELTQETFFKAFKGIEKFRGETSMKTWLFTIARNTYLNHARRSSTRMEHQMDTLEETFSDKKNTYLEIEEKIIIRKILLQLTEKERTFILLRHYHDMTYGDIAKVTGMTQGQVKIGLYRGREKFKEIYKKFKEA